jgi:hypothetical protein
MGLRSGVERRHLKAQKGRDGEWRVLVAPHLGVERAERDVKYE